MILTPPQHEQRKFERRARARWWRDERRMWLWLLLMAALGCAGIVLFLSGQ